MFTHAELNQIAGCLAACLERNEVYLARGGHSETHRIMLTGVIQCQKEALAKAMKALGE